MLTQKWNMEKALEMRFIEGLEEGWEKGKEEIVCRMLADGFLPDEVSKYICFPVEKIRKLEPISPGAE